MKQEIKEIFSFLRWRIIAVRYFTLLLNLKLKNILIKPNFLYKINDLEKFGYIQNQDMDEVLVNEIRLFYNKQIKNIKRKNNNQPFVNIMSDVSLVSSNPLIKYAFSDNVLGKANEYFDGKVSLGGIQLLYSFPNAKGEVKQSQSWHKDFGDSKSFHSITYLNDVFDEESGPFTFVDKINSKKISWSPFLRRIPDLKFEKELGSNEIIKFYGKAGSSILVDPSSCYHYGSRGSKARLALFISFNSNIPFTSGDIFTKKNAKKIRTIAKKVRPDINADFFDHLIRL